MGALQNITNHRRCNFALTNRHRLGRKRKKCSCYRNFSKNVTMTKVDGVWFDLFEALLPGKQYFSHVGTEPPLSGYYQYFFFFFFWGGDKYVLFKDTTRRPERGSNLGPLDLESEVLTTMRPRHHKLTE